jgi:hypothetical protein
MRTISWMEKGCVGSAGAAAADAHTRHMRLKAKFARSTDMSGSLSGDTTNGDTGRLYALRLALLLRAELAQRHCTLKPARRNCGLGCLDAGLRKQGSSSGTRRWGGSLPIPAQPSKRARRRPQAAKSPGVSLGADPVDFEQRVAFLRCGVLPIAQLRILQRVVQVCFRRRAQGRTIGLKAKKYRREHRIGNAEIAE